MDDDPRQSPRARLVLSPAYLGALGGARSRGRAGGGRADLMIESAVTELTAVVGTSRACAAVGRRRATHYRRLNPPAPNPKREPAPQPRALTAVERAQVLEVLHSERFVDMAPPSVYATLLDEGNYLASIPTMYRVLHSVDEVRERRKVAMHPSYVKPELMAGCPNSVWSWDITKLLGPAKWTYYYLYVILDIFSRYVVGWMVASCERAALAERLLADSIGKQGVDREQLTIHADRGSSMASKPVAFLLADLGVTKTHSRPHCPNDNPFSEAQFKTLKYMPEFPHRFGSQEDARGFCRRFFPWSRYAGDPDKMPDEAEQRKWVSWRPLHHASSERMG